MKLIKYTEKPQHWDELIKDYDSKTLFHQSNCHISRARIQRDLIFSARGTYYEEMLSRFRKLVYGG